MIDKLFKTLNLQYILRVFGEEFICPISDGNVTFLLAGENLKIQKFSLYWASGIGAFFTG